MIHMQTHYVHLAWRKSQTFQIWLQARLIIATSTVLALALSINAACFAETNLEMMKKGVAEYKAGDYSNSAGHFYAALTTEFNNPSLHYYMASCYVHLKDPESAVREFRIAYALAPNSDVGAYATTALKYYGLTTDGAANAKAKAAAKQLLSTGAPFKDPSHTDKNASALLPGKSLTDDNSINLIHSQAERAKNSRREQSEKLADEIKHQGDDRITKAVNATGSTLSSDPKERESQILALPDDVKTMLNKLKSEYDSKQESQIVEGQTKVQKLDEAADNLQSLIEKHHSVQAAGSNLYVRNYKKKPEPISH